MRALLLALIVGAAAFSAAAQESIGVVKSAEGEVMVRRASLTGTLAAGDALFADDHVSTGAESVFAAALVDGATLSLGQNAALQIGVFTFEPERGLYQLIVRLIEGRFVYASGKIGEAAPDKVRFETPYMTIGTRGTRFAVSLPPADESTR